MNFKRFHRRRDTVSEFAQIFIGPVTFSYDYRIVARHEPTYSSLSRFRARVVSIYVVLRAVLVQ